MLTKDLLNRLHPSAIEGEASVHALMVRLWRDGVVLRRGVNRRISPELARISRVASDRLVLATQDFEPSRRNQIWLNFELDQRPYFFAASIIASQEGQIETQLPEVVYRAERRDRVREPESATAPTSPLGRVVVQISDEISVEGNVADVSAGGLGLAVPATLPVRVGSNVVLRFMDGPERGSVHTARVCHASRAGGQPNELRLGVALRGPSSGEIAVVGDDSTSSLSWRRARQAWEIVAAGAAARSERLVRAVTGRVRPEENVRVLDIQNRNGELVRAIVDFSGEAPIPGAPLVLIPPAWGRTKETLLPLAATIVATFERAREPVSVVRFDGVRRRGESFNDEVCRRPGREHHRFTFSQGVDDILTVLDQLAAHPDFGPARVALVTFSAASIDGRRAVAIDAGRQINGWVSVVGSADLQSMMRVVSGGIDFVAGVERGLSFGLQEILGVEVDIDLAGQDALKAQIAFLEDSCRDMDRVEVPVTWIHGRHDAWMDLSRVRAMLSRGKTSNRKLIVVPTGHQLRTSREALEVFQLISEEVSAICLGRKLQAKLPSLNRVEGRRLAERARLPESSFDQRAFWKRYLLGRDGSVGIELMTNASSYRRFMHEQIAELSIASGGLVADVGSGTGSFLSCVHELPTPLQSLVIHEFDYVREAFLRAKAALQRVDTSGQVRASFVECDLSANGRTLSIPCAPSVYDAAIASLFISYVEDPLAVLREIRRVLKPGGRLVVSGLRRDADVSKLFVEAIAEISRGEGAGQAFGAGDLDLEHASRNFLNDAAHLLDFEERGLFQFRDSSELASLIQSAGFLVNRVWTSFGDPPQAAIVSASKPF